MFLLFSLLAFAWFTLAMPAAQTFEIENDVTTEGSSNVTLQIGGGGEESDRMECIPPALHLNNEGNPDGQAMSLRVIRQCDRDHKTATPYFDFMITGIPSKLPASKIINPGALPCGKDLDVQHVKFHRDLFAWRHKKISFTTKFVRAEHLYCDAAWRCVQDAMAYWAWEVRRRPFDVRKGGCPREWPKED